MRSSEPPGVFLQAGIVGRCYRSARPAATAPDLTESYWDIAVQAIARARAAPSPASAGEPVTLGPWAPSHVLGRLRFLTVLKREKPYADAEELPIYAR
jgi:hypothetical protein